MDDTTAFISNDEFLKFYDARLIGQLVNDTGEPVESANLADDANLQIILEAASGFILSACAVGGRYTELDLISLTGNGLAFLKNLTADLGIYQCVLRRGLPLDEYPQAERALKVLEALEKGQMIFPVPAVIDAGHAASPAINIQTIANNNWVRDSIRFYPTRRLTREQL